MLVVDNAADVDLATRQLYRIGFDHYAGWITVAEARAGGLLKTELEQVDFPEFDVAKSLASGEIIDVRTTSEFCHGHIEGAHSFPYTRLKNHLAELPADKRLFVHCGTGKRASLATSFLCAEGFDAVHVDGVCAECERIANLEGVAH